MEKMLIWLICVFITNFPKGDKTWLGRNRPNNIVNMCIHDQFSLGRQDMEEMLIC